MLARIFGSVLCVAALGTVGLMSAAAADTKASEIKDGIPGKIVKVDAEQATVTIAGEDGRERTYNITEETVIVGPRGGAVHKRLKDPRFHSGLAVVVVADGKSATQLHLGYDRKARKSTAAAAGTSPSETPSTDAAPTPAPKTRTSRFRGLIDSTKTPAPKAEKEEAEDDDNEFPGKVKSVDPAKRMLVITLLNGKDRSFLLPSDVKVTVNGRTSRRGLSDASLKTGNSLTVVTETGGRKVKEVKVSLATRSRLKKAS
jgi:hypothetical protein